MQATTALAMMNIALSTTLCVNRSLGCVIDIHDILMYDPCSGSGSLPAAALNLGVGEVLGSDLRADFILRARANLLELGYDFKPPQVLTEEGGDGWLDVDAIRDLGIKRAKARKGQDFDGADVFLGDIILIETL